MTYNRNALFIMLLSCFLTNNVSAEIKTNYNGITSSQDFAQFNLSPQAQLSGVLILSLILTNEIKGKSLKDQLDPKIFLRNFASVYTHCWFTTLCHELGHAVASLVFTGSPIDITMGELKPLHGPGSIKIASIDPLHGVALMRNANSEWKNFVSIAAGPIAGIAGYYFLKTVKKFAHIYSKNSSDPERKNSFQLIAKAAKKALMEPCSLDSLALGNLMYLLIPMFDGGDGTKLWKMAGANPEFVDSIAKKSPGIIYGLSAVYALRQTYLNKQQPD